MLDPNSGVAMKESPQLYRCRRMCGSTQLSNITVLVRKFGPSSAKHHFIDIGWQS